MASRRSFLDDIDKEILKLVQLDSGRPSLSKLAQKLNISKAKVNYRLNRLENEDIIQGYHAKVNPSKLGKDQQMIIRIRAKFGPGYHKKVGEMLSNIPGVFAVYFVFGENDFVVLARASNREAIFEKMQILFNSELIERTTTEIVTKAIKEDNCFFDF
ncbi:Lrp/AsnC family transcriptional regulator [Promethearchaeum syntrophicum]|uniref:Lrp/AsnC family transcriptional regulator n=1 Tax=Promethearchaeum syntrophicum TaxID=2594042 RepID=A0A5B9D5M5_9ARCH|nr:Lrp/AsnC family transcriptional regulator [Candidatus Prometheoarchaeum syntrophicum]QEE14384.1 putative HTH-type transcriptional regulator [Candidatus Prometheoarchaeum syntrophicum]